jgi:NADPH2:quinone reductase
MHLAAVNPPDALMAQGKYQVGPPVPFVLGIEGVATVLEAGPGVTHLVAGQRVMAYLESGCFADEVVAPSARVNPVPDGMPDEVACGFLLAYGTSYYGLVARGRLNAGDSLVVTGAAGGLGASATQIGKALGATVIALARGRQKGDFCKTNGADNVVDPAEADLRARLKTLTGGRGPQVVYDVVGGDLTEALLRSIAPMGRLLIAGYASGIIPAVKGNLVLLKQADVIGVSFRQYFEQRPQDASRDLQGLCYLWRQGGLKPARAEVVPFERACESLEAISQGRVVGKRALRLQ